MITGSIGSREPLRVAIEASLKELAAVELDDMSPATALEIVKIAVIAAATRSDFLDKFKDGEGRMRTALEQVLNAIIATAFPGDDSLRRTSWTLAASSTLQAITEVAFAQLAESGVDAARIAVLREALTEVAAAIEGRQAFSIERFEMLLIEKLNLVA